MDNQIDLSDESASSSSIASGNRSSESNSAESRIEKASTSQDSDTADTAVKLHWKPIIALLFVALFWGINLPIFKYALTYCDAFVFNATRLVFSSITLCFIVMFFARKRSAKSTSQSNDETESKPAENRIQFFILAVGSCLLTGFIYQVLFLMGIDRTTSGNTALLLASMPMWTALISCFATDEQFGRLAWIGLVIAFAGTAIVALNKEFSAANVELLGNILTLCGAITWSVGSVMSRPVLKKLSSLRLAFYSCAGTLPLHIGIALFDLEAWNVFIDSAHRWEILWCAIYSGVFSTGIAYALWNYGVQQLGPAHASIYQYLSVIIAILCGVLFLKEALLALQIMGGAMIIGGLVLSSQSRRQDKANKAAGKPAGASGKK